jgi:hypothetical protein
MPAPMIATSSTGPYLRMTRGSSQSFAGGSVSNRGRPEPCFKPGERTLEIGLALFRHQAIVALRCTVGYALAGAGDRMKYSVFSLLGQALRGHSGWTPAWRKAERRRSTTW